MHTQDEFQSYAKELFELVRSGALKLSVHKEYDLSTEGIRQAQEDISESRRARASAPELDSLVNSSRSLPGNTASRKTSGKLLIKVAA